MSTRKARGSGQCWRLHHDCAIAEIEWLHSQLERMREESADRGEVTFMREFDGTLTVEFSPSDARTVLVDREVIENWVDLKNTLLRALGGIP